MDYEKKDFRKLYEDLVKSDWFKRAYHNKSLGECPFDIPELVESEDERIRKRLIEYFEGFRMGNAEVKWEGLTVQEVLAWLEKRKETGIQWLKSDNVKNPDKPYVDKAGMFYTTDGRMCYASEIEKRKEQKPDSLIYDKDLDKAAREFYLSGGADSPFDSTGLVPIVRMAEFGAAWMKERMEKEQKPVEHSAKGRRGRMGGIPEYVRRKAEAFKDKMEPPYDADDICTAYEAGALESAKPAELEQLAKLREMTHEIRDAYERGIEVGHVESKQEWSEEDKDAISGAIGILLDDNNPSFVFPEHSKLSVGEIVKRLKSLRPVSKESLQPHWKPSEEQMESLAYAIQVLNSNPHPKSAKAYQDLQTLYKNIKYGN